MCSMKCEAPHKRAGSYRPPTPTQIPRLMLAMCGISAVAMASPDSSWKTRYMLFKRTWYRGGWPHLAQVPLYDFYNLIHIIG